MVERNGGKPMCDANPALAAMEILELDDFMKGKRHFRKVREYHIFEWIFGSGLEKASERLNCLGIQLKQRKLERAFAKWISPNAEHQRWEPAATERRMQTELNGWLPSAACYGCAPSY